MPKFKGQQVKLQGRLPAVGEVAPDFTLVRQDLTSAPLEAFKEDIVVLNVFISSDTSVCAASAESFEKVFHDNPHVKVLSISMDLPFAMQRFCSQRMQGARQEFLSAFRSDFGSRYGVRIVDGALTGLLTRAVFVLDKERRIIYEEVVEELTTEPNYAAAAEVINSLQVKKL